MARSPRASALTTAVEAGWNGATAVASRLVPAGDAPGSLAPLASAVASAGFETPISAATTVPYVAVEALGACGQVLGTSVAVAPAAA